MLLKVNQFGGVASKVLDPAQLPLNKSVAAVNCRFDRGGVSPLYADNLIQAMPEKGVKSIFLYRIESSDPSRIGDSISFLEWLTDVDAVNTPFPNDKWARVFFTEQGKLRVTSNDLIGPNPQKVIADVVSLNPSPPAPFYSLPISTQINTPILALIISSSATAEDPGVYNLNFSGGNGQGASGTYTVTGTAGATAATNVISSVNLTSGGQGYTATVTVATQSGAGAILATIKDPTLIETRAYVYTFVNKYGAQGPPSQPSNFVDVFDGDPVTIYLPDPSFIARTPFQPDGDFAVTEFYLYRINQTASGTAQYQLVPGPLSDGGFNISSFTEYVDTVLDSGLGEVLPSVEYDGPPAGIQGLISLPNGSLAAFVGNTVCFTPPFAPHAWPASYQKTTDQPVVGLAAFGMNVLVLTQGLPYVVAGNDPANSVMEKINGLSCVSKRGIVTGDEIVIYPSPQGLNAVGAGINKLVTEPVVSQKTWNDNNPSTLVSFYWEGKYIGFNKPVTADPALKGTSGAILDPKTADLVGVDVWATAGYYDHSSGILYLVINDVLYQFSQNTALPRSITYLSRLYRYSRNAFSCMKVFAPVYPVSITLTYPDVSATVQVTATSIEPIRIPPHLSESCQIEITGPNGVSEIFMANVLEELPV